MANNTDPESRAKMARIWALRNAKAEAGEDVLAAAELGDAEKIVEVARARHAEFRRQFPGEPLIYRLPSFSEEEAS